MCGRLPTGGGGNKNLNFQPRRHVFTNFLRRGRRFPPKFDCGGEGMLVAMDGGGGEKGDVLFLHMYV